MLMIKSPVLSLNLFLKVNPAGMSNRFMENEISKPKSLLLKAPPADLIIVKLNGEK